MRLMRAWGYGECRIFPTSMPGTLRSSVYLPAPVVFSAASTIAVGLPMMENVLMNTLLFDHSLSFLAKRGICFMPVATRHLAVPCCSAAIADLIAAYIWLYPVQRHRLLLNAVRTSASDGSEFSAISDFTVMMNPGVQKPH